MSPFCCSGSGAGASFWRRPRRSSRSRRWWCGRGDGRDEARGRGGGPTTYLLVSIITPLPPRDWGKVEFGRTDQLFFSFASSASCPAKRKSEERSCGRTIPFFSVQRVLVGTSQPVSIIPPLPRRWEKRNSSGGPFLANASFRFTRSHLWHILSKPLYLKSTVFSDSQLCYHLTKLM